MSNDYPKNGDREPGIQKEAGLTVYLMEELTDARMRCDQLKRYVAQAVKMVNNSDKRDHFFEVAGNLLYGIPEALFKLDKALDATALAASRLDYEELKQQLKPEKAEELEQILNEVRIRHIDRRSDPATLLKGKTAMRVFKAASQDRIASALRKVADEVEAGALHPTTASVRLYRVLMALSQTAEQAMQAMAPFQADSREEVMKGFKDANPNLSQAELEEIADQWEKNKNVVKDKQATSKDDWADALKADEKMLAKLKKDVKTLEDGGKVENLTLANAKAMVSSMEQVIANKKKLLSKLAGDDAKLSEEEKQSKFEEGKPADPTENMSPEDAKKWKEEHDKNKDKFKSAGYVSAFGVEASAPARTEGYVSVFASDRVAAPQWTPTETKVWYELKGSDGDRWFFCQEIQKNGGMAGIMVDWPWGRGARRPQPKAKKYSTGKLFEGDKSGFKKVKDVPDEVREAAKDKGASGA